MCGFAEGYDRLRELLPGPFTYSGFDYADEIVNTMRRNRPELDIRHQDATRFSAPAEYDLVLLISGLHHLHDRAGDVVQRLAAALRPGGLFLSFEPTHGNRLTRLVRERIYLRNPVFEAATERAFAVDELAGFFTAAGLRCRHMFHPGLLAYILYYTPDAFPQLNRGGAPAVRAAFALDGLFMDNVIGRLLSFATFSIWEKPA